MAQNVKKLCLKVNLLAFYSVSHCSLFFNLFLKSAPPTVQYNYLLMWTKYSAIYILPNNVEQFKTNYCIDHHQITINIANKL